MIFTERKKVKLWISEDIFDNTPTAAAYQPAGERDFVISFLSMLND